MVRLPAAADGRPRVGFFPGSTIGNFDRDGAVRFLRSARQVLGDQAALLVGVDLVKDEATLSAAYDDSQGVTARFNKNLLVRINRELGGDFDIGRFRHEAFYDESETRLNEQGVRIGCHLAATTHGSQQMGSCRFDGG